METVCVIRIVFCKKSVCKIGSFIGIPKSVIPFPRNFEKKMGLHYLQRHKSQYIRPKCQRGMTLANPVSMSSFTM